MTGGETNVHKISQENTRDSGRTGRKACRLSAMDGERKKLCDQTASVKRR